MELTQETLEQKKAQLAKDSIRVQAVSGKGITLGIGQVGQNFVSIYFDTLPGNKPSTYGNTVSIWQNADETIPWDSPAYKTKKIDKDTPNGDAIFEGLNLDLYSYVLGYSVGPELGSGQQKYGNVCATAFVPAIGGDPIAPFSSSVKVGYIGGNSLTADFILPPGVFPKTNGAWIGVWESSQASYTRQPDYSNNIQVDKARGSAYINGITIGRGATYTIGLFMSGWAGGGRPNTLTTMACTFTFTAPS
ncbi:hypothetical protein [Chitinophaga flava]|uniref:Uncharacterized protein n=1 Tax=Chitinophaga flava TaxID=2259036 RepID=A0A365XUP4_9BACT|nr:hypothetical protein [Chitinophaga flava]RBL89315.1 hypothetical protein DF182_22600 [Chitinophaga flava]